MRTESEKEEELLSISLDRAIHDLLLAQSQARGVSQSEVIREALLDLAERNRKNILTRADVLSIKENNYARLKPVTGEIIQVPTQLAQPKSPSLTTAALIVPRRRVETGTLVKSVSFVWHELAEALSEDWSRAYDLPADKLEELVAGAFQKDGFDQVILTPRSNDHGRDIIATKRGVGCVKIIGSVKRYAARNMVRYDDVRALVGVLHGDQSSSKGMLITTSGFPKRILDDPFIKPFIPTRLELVNGAGLLAWIDRLRR